MTEGAAAILQERLGGSAEALTPDQFTQRIKAAVNPSYIRARQN